MTAESTTGPTILLVEDDSATRAEVARNLRAHGYRIVEAENVNGAIRAWEMRRSDVVLLDLGLPDGDGLEMVRHVRKAGAVPIVILSARGEESTKVAALEQGADDYVTKPFSTRELHARIRAVLRRTGGGAADAGGVIRNGPLEVDPIGHTVTVRGMPVTLVPREFQILVELLAHPGRLVTRGRLLRAVWGEAYRGEDHYIHVYVSQIRKKLAAANPEGDLTDLLVAEPGVGYRVRLPPPT
jgi:two-component system, OmpR family, KDP operon response regulator KdpE